MEKPITDAPISHFSQSTAFRRTLTRAIVYPLGLLIAVTAVFLWQLNSILQITQRVEHSNVIITQASVILNLMVDMETGLRGYWITNDAQFLDPYEEAQAKLESELARLRALVADNDSQTQNLNQIVERIANWRQYAANSLASKTDGQGYTSATWQRIGKEIMDGIREQLATFVEGEDQLRTERIHNAQSTSQFIIIMVILSGLVAGGILAVMAQGWLLQLSRTYERALITSSQQAEEISTQREWLRGVLSSIGEAVIATDMDGTVTFSNQVAAALTGWPIEEARGKPLATVYKVIHTKAAEPPSDTTTTQEVLLSSTDSKRLLTRQGQTIAIDDNTADIKDAHGKRVGTVLVFRDVTRRDQIEQERLRLIESQRRYADLLRRSNEQLHQFAYIASHDLQEPLRMVTSYLQLLEQRYSTSLDADAHDFIGFAVDGAARMKELITGLLTYARIETDDQTPHTLTSLQTVLDKVLTNLAAPIADSGTVITQDALPELPADSLQMMQLFQNLISNAIKFRGEQPPHIHIGAEATKDDWHFWVQDNGIGIAPDFQERIFGMFQRARHRSDYAGTGIGLAICKKVVERHHGRIWVESAAGAGTTFHFTLPLENSAP